MFNLPDPYYDPDRSPWFGVCIGGVLALVDCSLALSGMAAIWFLFEAWFQW